MTDLDGNETRVKRFALEQGGRIRANGHGLSDQRLARSQAFKKATE